MMLSYNQILLFGGNQGHVISSIKKAVDILSAQLGYPVKQSFFYESEPWGFEASQNFINQVVEFHSSLTPIELLDLTQQTELELGRQTKTGTHYESRPIDIDILFIGDMQMDTDRLTVPHCKLHERRFTLLPLMDEWSELIHPVLQKPLDELLAQCSDKSFVKRVD